MYGVYLWKTTKFWWKVSNIWINGETFYVHKLEYTMLLWCELFYILFIDSTQSLSKLQQAILKIMTDYNIYTEKT